MRDLEHEPRLEGFTLKPMSLAEAKALNGLLGWYMSLKCQLFPTLYYLISQSINFFIWIQIFANELIPTICFTDIWTHFNMAKVASGFVIFRKFATETEYLLLQTSYGIHHWTPPKGKSLNYWEISYTKSKRISGHVDAGESIIETAWRETQEESGLTSKDLKLYENNKKTLIYIVNGKPKTVHYWLAELVNPNATVILSDEHQDFKWLRLQEACDLAQFKEMQDTLKEFDELIRTF